MSRSRMSKCRSLEFFTLLFSIFIFPLLAFTSGTDTGQLVKVTVSNVNKLALNWVKTIEFNVLPTVKQIY